MSEATTKPETFTLTPDQLLSVWLSGHASAIATTLLAAGSTERLAQTVGENRAALVRQRLLADPILREQILEKMRQELAGNPVSDGWIR